jgi:hypothetical protein
VSAPWGTGATIDEFDGAIGVLEVAWGLVCWLFTITPGRVVSLSTAVGALGATCLVPLIVARALGIIEHHVITECMTLASGVVCILVPEALVVQEPI